MTVRPQQYNICGCPDQDYVITCAGQSGCMAYDAGYHWCRACMTHHRPGYFFCTGILSDGEEAEYKDFEKRPVIAHRNIEGDWRIFHADNIEDGWDEREPEDWVEDFQRQMEHTLLHGMFGQANRSSTGNPFSSQPIKFDF